MKNELIMYLTDKEIICYQKKEAKYFSWKIDSKIIKFGKVIHRPKFQNELNKFFKKEKILKKFYRNIIYFLTPPTFEEIDKEIMQITLEDFLVSEVRFFKEVNLYQGKKNTIWVNIFDNYAYITFLNEKNKKTILWQKENEYSIEENIQRIIEKYPKIKKIICIGSIKTIPHISQKIEIMVKKRVLYYEDYDQYLIKMFLRHNF